jgi:hypothetical protein
VRWLSGVDELAVVTADLGGGEIALSPVIYTDPWAVEFPASPELAFAGERLSFFWAQDDGSVNVKRFFADLTGDSSFSVVVGPHPTQQTIATSAIGAGEQTVVTWADRGDLGYRTFATSFAADGTITGGPGLLHEGTGYDSATTLAFGEGHVFGVWSTHAEALPDSSVSTTLAAIEPGSATVMSTETVAFGAYQKPTGLAVEADRVSVVMLDVLAERATILSRPLGGGAFAERTSFEAAFEVAIARGECGRLAALVPAGAMSTGNLMPTGLSLRSVGQQGSVELPVTGDDVEAWSLAAVDGGFVAAWIENNTGSSPGRALRMAYVKAP